LQRLTGIRFNHTGDRPVSIPANLCYEPSPPILD
jgi:hypothetical protein